MAAKPHAPIAILILKSEEQAVLEIDSAYREKSKDCVVRYGFIRLGLSRYKRGCLRRRHRFRVGLPEGHQFGRVLRPESFLRHV